MTHGLSVVPEEQPERVWMTREQVAGHLQVGVSTIDAWRWHPVRNPTGMPWHGTRGAIRLDRHEVDAWFASRSAA